MTEDLIISHVTVIMGSAVLLLRFVRLNVFVSNPTIFTRLVEVKLKEK